MPYGPGPRQARTENVQSCSAEMATVHKGWKRSALTNHHTSASVAGSCASVRTLASSSYKPNNGPLPGFNGLTTSRTAGFGPGRTCSRCSNRPWSDPSIQVSQSPSLEPLTNPSGDSGSGSNQPLFDVLSPFATVLASHDVVSEYALDSTGEFSKTRRMVHWRGSSRHDTVSDMVARLTQARMRPLNIQ